MTQHWHEIKYLVHCWDLCFRHFKMFGITLMVFNGILQQIMNYIKLLYNKLAISCYSFTIVFTSVFTVYFITKNDIHYKK